MKKKPKYLFGLLAIIIIVALGAILGQKKWQYAKQVVKVNTSIDEEHPRVALTFDDGPHCIYTAKLLEGLKERKVKASFFLIGKNIAENEAIVKQMQEEGHLIGNHTFHHLQLNQLSEKKACEEIRKTSNRIYEVTGVYTAFVRPPYGEWIKGLDCHVTMLPVFWSIDSLDWTTTNVKQIVNRVLKNVRNDDIILMHDVYDSSVEAALEIVDNLLLENYEFVTVDELLLE